MCSSFQLFFLCPFLSSLRLLPSQFPFVSKHSGNFLLFVNVRCVTLVEGKRAVIRCIYGLLYGTFMKPNLIKLIAFFSYTSQHVAEGQLNNFACVGWALNENFQSFSFSWRPFMFAAKVVLISFFESAWIWERFGKFHLEWFWSWLKLNFCVWIGKVLRKLKLDFWSLIFIKTHSES